MKEHEDSFNSEAIDAQTERWSSGLSPDERRLIQALYASSREYAQENEQSLERIWEHLVQAQGLPALLQETPHGQPESGQFLREGKAMQEEDISQETRFSIPDTRFVKRPRRALRRTLSLSAAVVVVLAIILSWVLLSSGLRQTAAHSSRPTKTGAAQKELSSGTLVCSFSDNENTPVPIQPTLDWSSLGRLAVTYQNLETASGQNCGQKSANLLPGAQQATWSPDGKRLLVLTGTYQAEVLASSTGHVLASFQGSEPGDTVEQSVWLSNDTVVSAVQAPATKTGAFAISGGPNGNPGPTLIQIWNANTGALIRTALTLDSAEELLGLNVGQLPISPDGKYVATIKAQQNSNVEIWNIASGKLVNTIPYNQSDNGINVSALAWSPDGAFLALGLPATPEVQIWSVATGQLTASFKDSDDSAHVIGALSWSPNGKYLAESSSAIHLWDVKAQKIVATFGKVNSQSLFIPTLAWSLGSTMLASTTNDELPQQLSQNTVNVWRLS